MAPNDRHFYQGKGVAPEEARKIALALFERDRGKPLLIGPVCVEIGQNYGLNETEKLLDEMVLQGLLRPATPRELREVHRSHVQKGYVLATSTPRL
jgi:hypothetical protein